MLKMQKRNIWPQKEAIVVIPRVQVFDEKRHVKVWIAKTVVFVKLHALVQCLPVAQGISYCHIKVGEGPTGLRIVA